MTVHEASLGQPSAFTPSWRKLMMWVFIVTDALLFASFLAAYGFQRLGEENWPDRARVFHMPFIVIMTFILITSSATMATAVAAVRNGSRSTAARFLLLTILGGLCFLGMQAFEWSSLIRAGARLHSNPWGPAAFSGFFFLITGFHGTHVFLGVVILSIVARRVRAGTAGPEGVELAGLYWHFVDLVWVFIFGLFYLI